MTVNLPFACVVIGCILCIIGGAIASLYSFRNNRDLQLYEQENRSLVEYTQKMEKRNQYLAKKNEELNVDNRVLHQKIYDLSNRIIELNPNVLSKDAERYLDEPIDEISSSTGRLESGKSEKKKRKE